MRPALADEGIVIVTWSELDDAERDQLSTYFHEQVFPVLTPLAVDPAHPFPFVSGLSLNLAITVKQPDNGGQHFARIKVPDNVDRFVQLAGREGDSKCVRFLPMEELIAAFLPVLFPGLEIVEHHAFRSPATRTEVEEDRDEDLLQAMERELARRRFGSPVRLEVADDMTENMLELLLRELDVHPGDVIEVPGLLDLSSLWQIYGVDRPALKDPPFVPATPPAFGERETPKSIFATLRDGRAGASPLRLVLHHCATVHRAGGRGPQCAGDQADLVPHFRRLAHRQRADRRGRGRQAGRRAGGDQGVSTSRPTSNGRRHWKMPVCMWSTG